MDQLTLTPAHEIPMFKNQMADVLIHGETVNDVGVEQSSANPCGFPNDTQKVWS